VVRIWGNGITGIGALCEPIVVLEEIRQCSTAQDSNLHLSISKLLRTYLKESRV
jgi:hypothetical protein